jgi:hypothetical protein
MGGDTGVVLRADDVIYGEFGEHGGIWVEVCGCGETRARRPLPAWRFRERDERRNSRAPRRAVERW